MKTILLLFFLFYNTLLINAQFVVDDVQVGTSEYKYIDPEFIDGYSQVCWIDLINKKIWMGNINPKTGLFFSGNGLDLLIDSNVVPVDSSLINGPEWGADFEGPAVFYTKRDDLGIRHVWRAITIPNLIKTKLTTGSLHHVHWQGSISSTNSFINIVFRRYDSLQNNYYDYWCNENNIVYSNPISNVYPGTFNNINAGPKFIQGTDYFVYSREVNFNKIEIVRVNTLNNTLKYITNDNIPKVDVFGFIAAEYNNEICYSARISDTTFAVYRFLQPNDFFATRFATLRIPINDPHKYLGSIEVIQPSINGTTYFSVLGNLQDNIINPIDGSMWILGLGIDSTNRFARRVDEGVVSGVYKFRYEPETMFGQNELFLYYTLQDSVTSQLRRCKTGIFINPSNITTISNEIPDKYLLHQNYPNPFNPVTNIKFDIAKEGFTELVVYDITGREVQTIVNEYLKPASYEVIFDGSNLSSGIYFYTISVNEFSQTKKMLYIK